MNTKLWVDDERPAPDETWDVAKRAAEAYNLIDTHDYSVISLDFTLIGMESGFDIVVWMRNNNRWPETIIAHSSSGSARSLILESAREYGPADLILIDSYTGETK